MLRYILNVTFRNTSKWIGEDKKGIMTLKTVLSVGLGRNMEMVSNDPKLEFGPDVIKSFHA